MLPALMTFILFLLSILCITSARREDAIPSGEAFLHSHGVETLGSVIYYKHSENASNCLETEEAQSRLLQLCDVRAVLEQCVEREETIHLVDCRGVICRGQFSANHTRCLLEKSGLTSLSRDSHGEFALCPPPAVKTGFFKWQKPPWALAVGSGGFFDCITPLPPKSKIARRLHCVDDQPVIQHRIVFHSPEFLKSDERKVKCMWTQSCRGPQAFVSQFACYDIDRNKRPADLDAQSETPVESTNTHTEIETETRMDDVLELESGNDQGSASWIKFSPLVLFLFSMMFAWI